MGIFTGNNKDRVSQIFITSSHWMKLDVERKRPSAINGEAAFQ
jgi:hypothetical protein